MPATTATFKIADDEPQTYTLSIPSSLKGAIIEDGDTATVELTADPKRSIAATVPTFTVVRAPTKGYAFVADGTFAGDASPDGLAAGNAGASAKVTLGTIGAVIDENRVDDNRHGEAVHRVDRQRHGGD